MLVKVIPGEKPQRRTSSLWLASLERSAQAADVGLAIFAEEHRPLS